MFATQKSQLRLIFLVLFFAGLFLPAQDNQRTFTVQLENQRHAAAVVLITATGETLSRLEDGRFLLPDTLSDDAQLTVTASGYEARTLTPARIVAMGGVVVLVSEQHILENLVINPGLYSVGYGERGSAQALSRQEINARPHFGDDVFRAVSGLPGLSSGDISSKFTIRGGEHREILVTLDGMELYEPFHLRDFQGVFSIIDADAVNGMEIMTGGFSSEYGDRLSGVMAFESLEPVSESRYTMGIGFSNARFMASGRFADGLGAYVFSARRGYLDLLLDMAGNTDDDLSPVYYDYYGKLSYAFSSRHSFSFSTLGAEDELIFEEEDDGEERVDSEYGSLYLWANWRALWTDRLSSDTILFTSTVDSNRDGFEIDEASYFNIRDKRQYDYTGVKQVWSYRFTDNFILKGGFQFKDVRADYDYLSEVHDEDAEFRPVDRFNQANLTENGEIRSLFLGSKFRLTERLAGELGVRWDEHTYLDESEISPRLSLAYQAGNGTLRFAWGRYYQGQGIHELQVTDGRDQFNGLEGSEQWVLGYEHQFGSGDQVRVEAYYKDLFQLNTRYENLFTILEAFPELSDDRIAVPAESGRVQGVEVSWKRAMNKTAWAVNYAWSKAEDKIQDRWYYRKWDQTHAINLNFNWRWSQRWNFNAAWHYNSGWRTAQVFLVADDQEGYALALGNFNENRLPAYHRLDMRFNRVLALGKDRGLTLYLDLTNAYDRTNVRGIENPEIIYDAQGNPRVVADEEGWLPMLPSVGFTWTF